MKNDIKIKVINSPDDLSKLDSNEKALHLAFRPKSIIMMSLLTVAPNLEIIQLSESYRKTLSQPMIMFMEMNDIILTTGSLWGHRTDLLEYYTPPAKLIEDIETYRKNNEQDEHIIKKLTLRYNLSEGLLKYIFTKI